MNVGRSRRIHDTSEGGPPHVARLGVCLLKGGRRTQKKSVWSPRHPSTFFRLPRGRGVAVGEGAR